MELFMQLARTNMVRVRGLPVWSNHSSSLPVFEKLNFFNEEEFLEELNFFNEEEFLEGTGGDLL